MKNKKILISIIISVCAVLLLIGIICAIKGNSNTDKNVVTRYEWIEMLGEQFGINEYSNAEPYFKDVDADSPYFNYVQSAVEWEIIEDTARFEGEKPADGKFIALTTMRAIGKYKVQIYLDTDKEPDETDYLNIAYEHELISEEQLKKYFTEEECKDVLIKAQEMNDFLLWKDDLVKSVYQENVKEIDTDDIISYSEDELEIENEASVKDGLSVGDIIIFEVKNTGLKTAGKIESISADGKINLVAPAIEEVYESLTISDINSIGGDEIIEYYRLNNLDTYESTPMRFTRNSDYTLMPMHTTEFNGKNEGVSFYVYSKEGNLYVGIKDKNTEDAVEFLVESGLDKEAEIKCAFDITNIQVGTQLDWTMKDGLEYANVMLYTEFVETMNMNVISEEKEIPLFKKPIIIPVAHGVASVNIECNLVISAEGEISIEAKLPVGTNLCYEKGKGIRNNKMELPYTEPEIQLSAELGISLCPELTLEVLKVWKPLNAGVEVGVKGSAEFEIRPSQNCTDINVVYPLLTIEAEIDSGIGVSYSDEWEVITKENAKFKLNWHYEQYSNGTAAYVDECTYGKEEGETVKFEKDEDIDDGTDEDNSMPQETAVFLEYSTYELPIALYLSSSIEDMGDYCKVKGRLEVEYAILISDFDDIEEGESFIIQDKEFVLGDRIKEVPKYVYSVYCIEDDCTYYICRGMPETVGSRFGDSYVTVLYDIPDSDFVMETMRPLINDLGEQDFIINKDAYIVSSGELGELIFSAREYDPSETEEEKFIYYEEQRKEKLENRGHTVEEGIKDKILLDGWYDITDSSLEMRFYVTFDENGAIDSMIMESVY